MLSVATNTTSNIQQPNEIYLLSYPMHYREIYFKTLLDFLTSQKWPPVPPLQNHCKPTKQHVNQRKPDNLT